MALINTKTFDILEHYDLREPDALFFECDEELAPIVSLLNKKGYRTLFCCSGHLYDSISDSMLLDDPELTDEQIQGMIPGLLDVKRDNNGIRVVCRQNLDLKTYIMFDKSVRLPSVPASWRLDHGNTLSHNYYWDSSFNDVRDLEELKEKPFLFYRRRFDLLSDLYLWAEALPLYDPENPPKTVIPEADPSDYRTGGPLL